MSQKNEQEFLGWRKLLWPIHSDEVKKFLPMGIMMFCILFIYTVLRDTKDAILVNAPGAGAESLAFAKGIGVTISAVLFMLLYTKAANVFNREGLFYVTALPFLIFFGGYPYCIYPFVDSLHMSLESIQSYQQIYPSIKWMIPLIGNWTYTLFYILSELWGSAILSLLFWQFANAITPIKEARRFYGMFGFLGNFGLLLSGPAVIFVSHSIHNLGLSRNESTGLMLQYLMAFVIVAGVILLSTFYWMNRYVLTDRRYYDPEAMGEGKKKRAKLSMLESFKFILNSPYLGLIAILVLAYGVSINLFEGVWKGQIKVAYPTEVEFNRVMGGLSTITGGIAVILMLVGSNLLRTFSWRTCALITPVVLITGILIFFGVIYYNNSLLPDGMKIADAIGQGVINKELVIFAVALGLFVNAFGKAVKYSLFDPTKEMAYIPLDPELKIKGKAAVDVIGGRGGKSLGSYIQMGLLTLFSGSGLYQLVPIIAPIAIGIVCLWILSVFGLSKKFLVLTGKQGEERAGKEPACAS
ncbi:ADP/ATP translocase [Candidatus Protochlamydia naegleriophila]|uniref:ADP,ATP carrier protein n=1 Tax=Candidatus Protochlamydia naegleriophila TaxID=389348 RepID=A0A0U5JD23_9BACT|nr:Npt1/Npt2 family nucleotide transporter [Candidatus Protochlamydia naegleriophila]CUI17406.1 ADP/ATP translocase [Candidatus Protochlamydia naegleriophila]